MNEYIEKLLSYIKYLLVQHTGITNILDVITISMIIIGTISMLLSAIVLYDLNTTNCDRKLKSDITIILGFIGYFLVMIGFISHI